MTYLIADFNRDIAHNALIHVNKRNPNVNAELTAIATALSSDTTKHGHDDREAAGGADHRPHPNAFTNDILRFVSKGKEGNLTPTALSNAITTLQGTVLPPTNTTPPAVSRNRNGRLDPDLDRRHLDPVADLLFLPVGAQRGQDRRRGRLDL